MVPPRRLRRCDPDPGPLRPPQPRLFQDGGPQPAAPPHPDRPGRARPDARDHALLRLLHHGRHPDQLPPRRISEEPRPGRRADPGQRLGSLRPAAVRPDHLGARRVLRRRGRRRRTRPALRQGPRLGRRPCGHRDRARNRQGQRPQRAQHGRARSGRKPHERFRQPQDRIGQDVKSLGPRQERGLPKRGRRKRPRRR